MRVYISGPIAGHEDYMERFLEAEKHLEGKDYFVFNPAAVDTELPYDLTYEEHMYLDMGMLTMCDAIYMLKGWQESRGANREYGYALGRGIKVMFEEGS